MGLLKEPLELFRDFDDPPLYLYTVDTANLDAILGYDGRLAGVGAGRTRAEALNSCVGEALERYANSVGGEETRLMSCWSDLPDGAPHPSLYRLFSDEQYASPGFPFRPFTENSHIEWVRATDLTTSVPTWVPAQLVFLAHRPKPDEVRIGYSTSSGSGLGVSPAAAMLTGCLEAVERDAIMRTWLFQLPPKPINIPAADQIELQEAWTRYLAEGTCHVWDLTALAGVPTAMAAVRSEWPASPHLVFGSASAPLMKGAVRKAIIEAYHTRCWAKNIMTHRKGGEPSAQPMDFEDHVYLYAHPAAAKKTRFLFADTPRSELSRAADIEKTTAEGQLQQLVERLSAKSVGVYAVDLAPQDITDAGLFAYHITCPELCKLSVGMMPPFHAMEGLKGLEVASGHLGSAQMALNPDPHPFP